jgi:AcrR family transcriptional regulator
VGPRKYGVRQVVRLDLTTDDVVEGAIALIDREGHAALSMRRLGSEVGASTMGLYRYIDDRDALIEAIAERVSAGFVLPDPGPDWRDVARLTAHRYRAMVLEHPRVFGLLLRHETTTMRELFADINRVLRSCGLDRREAARVMVALTRFLLGWCQGEATGPVGTRETEDRLFARTLDALLSGFDPA